MGGADLFGMLPKYMPVETAQIVLKVAQIIKLFLPTPLYQSSWAGMTDVSMMI